MEKRTDWVREHHSRVPYPCGPHYPDRHPGCQDHCQKFLDAKAANEEARTKERKMKARLQAEKQAIQSSCTAKKQNRYR